MIIHDDTEGTAAIAPRLEVVERFLRLVKPLWPNMLKLPAYKHDPYASALQYLEGAIDAGGPRPAAAIRFYIRHSFEPRIEEMRMGDDISAMACGAVVALLVRTQARLDGTSSNEREFAVVYGPWEGIVPSAEIDPIGEARR